MTLRVRAHAFSSIDTLQRGVLMAPLLFILACGGAGGSATARGEADTAAGRAEPPAGDAETAPAEAPPPTETAAGVSDPTTAGDSAVAPGTGAPAAAPEAGQPEWMRMDEAGKKVELDIVAGLTGANGSLNYNGYAKGEMTLTVPVGWTVGMNFSSHDANAPHSLFVAGQAPPYPSVMPDQPAIPRAYSINLQQGIGPGKSDTLRFPVNRAGEYYLACAVPGHAASGMWDHFVVSAGASRPKVELKS